MFEQYEIKNHFKIKIHQIEKSPGSMQIRGFSQT